MTVVSVKPIPTLGADRTVRIAETFGLLADPTRLAIVLGCADDEVSSGDLADRLGLSPSLVSHHLRLLRAARLVKAERRGKQVFYVLADQCVRDVLVIMADHLFGHDPVDDPPGPNADSGMAVQVGWREGRLWST